MVAAMARGGEASDSAQAAKRAMRSLGAMGILRCRRNEMKAARRRGAVAPPGTIALTQRNASTAAAIRLNDQRDQNRETGSDSGCGQQHLPAVPPRPVDAGGATGGDQGGVEFRRARINTGQGAAGPLGGRLKRERVGIRSAARRKIQHAGMVTPIW